LKNSGDSPLSRPLNPVIEAVIAVVLLCGLIGSAAWWFVQRGYVLYWGDAQAHLNISRQLVESRVHGYERLGSVWLPVLHLICTPFVGNNEMWRSGLAGTIPAAICFVIAGVFFYLTAREAYGSRMSAAIVLACFALNPNVLYLASIPMTEIVFLAGLAAMMFAIVRFRATQSAGYLVLGVLASWWMCLTRYDGWFLIPFSGLAFAFFARNRRWAVLIGFGMAASLAPLYWFGHNWWETGSVLDFYNGPYSAMAIQGDRYYPGWHNWTTALRYYAEAGRLCSGWMLCVFGAVGLLCAFAKRKAFPVLFLLLTPAFYVWSMHSSKNPIHVPGLWPNSYYNTRYGIAIVPLAGFAVGAMTLFLPAKKRWVGFVFPLLCVVPWLWHPSPEQWICWKESQMNSIARRAWTDAGAQSIKSRYTEGQGILASASDVSGIFCRAGIPLRETLDIGDGPEWLANISVPRLVHQAMWAVALDGDPLSKVLKRGDAPYALVEQIETKGAPKLEIYRRQIK
jgi:hypothetical protein